MALYVNIKKLTKLNVLFKDIFLDSKTMNKRSDYHKIGHNSCIWREGYIWPFKDTVISINSNGRYMDGCLYYYYIFKYTNILYMLFIFNNF